MNLKHLHSLAACMFHFKTACVGERCMTMQACIMGLTRKGDPKALLTSMSCNHGEVHCNRHLKGQAVTHLYPMHLRGPAPNGMYAYG